MEKYFDYARKWKQFADAITVAVPRACFQNRKCNFLKSETSMIAVLTNENISAVSRIGSALGADKKINLGGRIYVIVHAAKTAWPATQGRPADVRGDDLYPAGGLYMAGSASYPC